ncbi:hypothetical protein MAIT1_00116 [Magnetofaba australis IT-1]|uniref:VWFA domain-containing protein n=2 Tax=Magnetofaba TaxID=1472292 RepID=A0A1Y2K941_9PROT|nr:hypothetical protein MAIT1_00116 [Magnetofaba australis IT-1]
MAAAMMMAGVGTAHAEARPSGSCKGFDFTPFYHKESLKWTGVTRVTRHDAPLYATESGGKAKVQLAFNQQGEVLAENEERLKLKTFPYQGQPAHTGWVNRADLLCYNLPVKGESGLEMKFFIRTDTQARDAKQADPTVAIFRDPKRRECVGGPGHCREGASRFHMYFVFDQQGDSVLLADRYRLEEGDALLGWADKNDGFIWNNAFSLRPREDLKAPDGGVGTICSYRSLRDAVVKTPSACSPIQGGVNWFKSPVRIPVLDIVDGKGKHVAPEEVSGSDSGRRFYQVAMARPGLVARAVGDGKVAISGGLIPQAAPTLGGLKSKQNVDIFFVLDATASMQGVIDAVRGAPGQRGVIQQIIEELQQVQGFQKTQFRFGFRVYRDPYADGLPGGLGDGVGEGFPLSSQCELGEAERVAEYDRFKEAILGVKVTEEDAEDDYEENIYGGLEQALSRDMSACSDHLKLLFVIGDNGYKPRLRRFDENGQFVALDKYKTPVDVERLNALMRGAEQVGEKANSVIPFFIQTPRRPEGVKHPNAYNVAYNRFEEQAKAILAASLPVGSLVSQHFLRMGEGAMVGRITDQVSKLSSSELIDEIIVDVRGGAALTSVIERLQRERVDIPGLYWHILKKGACGELGKQCQSRVYDTTLTGYIEANDKIVEELWISSSGLASWIRILSGFEGYFELPEPQLRRALISAMILGLQQEIRRPPIDVSGETPAEYAQRRGGLPVRWHSPLLSYNVNALSAKKVSRADDGSLMVLGDDGKVMTDRHGKPIQAAPVCELRRLALWAVKSKEMLEIVERDTVRPQYQASGYNSRRCPDATPNGHALQRIAGEVQAVPLGPTPDYRFGHAFGGRRGYWVPQEYLP